ncbi:DUF4179 domain-containing protein [Chungangia koreensis]|uniref:DUF4179 domain-containing protein n=1 Tax=Chungangia koreensis TaxID=752657 RepID=A0ABV8X2N3_9LACT
MNDLHEMLQVNIDDIQPEEVSEVEKKRVLQRILGKKKRPMIRHAAAIALLFFGLGSTAAVLSPTLASHIPIVRDITEYFEGETDQFTYFEDYASGVGLVQSSNGIDIEIAEAIYDGTSITITFGIQSDKDLGEHPVFGETLKTNGSLEGGSSIWTKKVSDTSYAGVITMTPELNGRSPRSVDLTWTPQNIWIYEKDETIEGDWSYKFKLKRIDVEGLPVNYSETKSGYKLSVRKVNVTGYTVSIPFSLRLSDRYFTTKSLPMPEFTVTDENGTEYEMITGLGSQENRGPIKGSYTLLNLEHDSKHLIVTPKISDKDKEILFESFKVDIPDR